MPTPTTQTQDAPPTAPGGEPYPEQKHAGAVGYGPEYHKGATFGDKMEGMKEELKGKVTKNPDRAQHGREMRTGVLKEKHEEDDVDPFASAQDQQQPSTPASGAGGDSEHQRAAAVAPEDTAKGQKQAAGERVQDQRVIDEAS
ncbi:hypothetical protein PUNSTDRAFT_122712 [Punctularia strigosozonata HHB-11173 SS5]|uniref:Uncharacterized protein n=1 Tax=Punctularia strigosozonata (strain HHB-11173) TaxID=741275 RepID=R7S4D2_PUNST|nr:uncharacterized protein PUNSTDRAFT_122712 [Punctularia strigosozonata HHB-11173 SS5]EIN04657.1 hypothetical protein PUNSTDRAFT_122712 [Punctularia strigosozonata HHB-11173 SS5]